MPVAGPGGVLYNTAADSGVPGLLDRLTGMVDQAVQNQDQLRGAVALGSAPASMSPGPSLFGRMFGMNMDGTPVGPGTDGQPVSSSPASPQSPSMAQPTSALSGIAGGLQNLFQNVTQKYGLPPGFLAQTAAIESKFNPNAVSPTGAAGMFGFTKGTAQQYGLGNPMDPVASADAAGRLAADNATTLTKLIGRPPSAGELYLAHQQGAVGAAALINNPNVSAGQALASVGADPNNITVNGGNPNMPAGAFAAKYVSRFGGGQMAQPATPQQPAMAYAPANGGASSPGQTAIASAAPPGGQPAQQGVGGAPQVPYGGLDGARAAFDPTSAAPQQGRSVGMPGGPGNTPLGSTPPGGDPTPPGPMPMARASTSATQPVPQQMAGAGGQVGQVAQGGVPFPGLAPAPTLDQIKAAVANPATRQIGMALWQAAIQPRAPIITHEGDVALSPYTLQPVYSAPVKLGEKDALMQGNNVISRAPPTYDLKQDGENDYGQKRFGVFNNQTGTDTPVAPMAGQGDAGSNAALSGDAYLATLSPQIANQVKAIAEGRAKLPSGTGSNSPFAQRLRGAVLQYDPTFDQADVDARFKTRTDFAAGGGVASAITAGNTALAHLGELSDAAEALNNSRLPIVNSIGQAIGTATGGNLAGTQFNNTVSKYVEEATKLYRGTGGTEADINRDISNLSSASSPAQLRTAINQQVGLIQGKLAALQDRWHQGMGPKASDYPLINAQGQATIARATQRAGLSPVGGGAPAPNLPVAQPAGSQPAPPQAAPSAPGGQMPTLSDPAQVRQLPSGTMFRTPDGRIGRAP